MTSEMKAYTRRLAVRLALLLTLFALLSTSLAVLLRYREALDSLLANHRVIRQNLAKMRMATAETGDTIAGFKRLLPNGYERKSAAMLLYTRLDEVRTRLPAGEITVKPLETKEGLLSLEFSFKPARPSYSSLINTLGQLELAVLPFVSVREISLQSPTEEKPGPLAIRVEGVLLTQAPAQDATATPAATVPPAPTTGGAR